MNNTLSGEGQLWRVLPDGQAVNGGVSRIRRAACWRGSARADPDATVHVASPSGISQARTRLGVAPVLRLYDDVVVPIATPATPGAWSARIES